MKKYDRVVVFDLETSGLKFEEDKIIEFGALVLEKNSLNKFEIKNVVNELVNPGFKISDRITELTGITNEQLSEKGIQEVELYYQIKDLFISDKKTLLVAYNAQFDLSFIHYLLLRLEEGFVNIEHDVLDVMAVYKDHHEYPHRLINAIEMLELGEEFVNSHRACDDAKATWAVLKVLYKKLFSYDYNVDSYINLIGYNKKYSLSGFELPQCSYYPVGWSNLDLHKQHYNVSLNKNIDREEE